MADKREDDPGTISYQTHLREIRQLQKLYEQKLRALKEYYESELALRSIALPYSGSSENILDIEDASPRTAQTVESAVPNWVEKNRQNNAAENETDTTEPDIEELSDEELDVSEHIGDHSAVGNYNNSYIGTDSWMKSSPSHTASYIDPSVYLKPGMRHTSQEHGSETKTAAEAEKHMQDTVDHDTIDSSNRNGAGNTNGDVETYIDMTEQPRFAKNAEDETSSKDRSLSADGTISNDNQNENEPELLESSGELDDTDKATEADESVYTTEQLCQIMNIFSNSDMDFEVADDEEEENSGEVYTKDNSSAEDTVDRQRGLGEPLNSAVSETNGGFYDSGKAESVVTDQDSFNQMSPKENAYSVGNDYEDRASKEDAKERKTEIGDTDVANLAVEKSDHSPEISGDTDIYRENSESDREHLNTATEESGKEAVTESFSPNAHQNMNTETVNADLQEEPLRALGYNEVFAVAKEDLIFNYQILELTVQGKLYAKAEMFVAPFDLTKSQPDLLVWILTGTDSRDYCSPIGSPTVNAKIKDCPIRISAQLEPSATVIGKAHLAVSVALPAEQKKQGFQIKSRLQTHDGLATLCVETEKSPEIVVHMAPLDFHNDPKSEKVAFTYCIEKPGRRMCGDSVAGPVYCDADGYNFEVLCKWSGENESTVFGLMDCLN